MTEKDLIKGIKQLKGIKPREDWVLLTKNNILGNEPELSFVEKIRLVFQPKFTLAGGVSLMIIFGLIMITQHSLPGQLLYPVKRIAEKGRALFVSHQEKQNYNLELVDKRLEELAKVSQANQVANLAPALNELETTKVEVRKGISDLKNMSQKDAIAAAKKIAPKLSQINKRETQVFASLGLEPDDEQPAEKTIVELLIKDLSEQTLNEGQMKLFQEAEKNYQYGNYNQALEEILTLSNSQI